MRKLRIMSIISLATLLLITGCTPTVTPSVTPSASPSSSNDAHTQTPVESVDPTQNITPTATSEVTQSSTPTTPSVSQNTGQTENAKPSPSATVTVTATPTTSTTPSPSVSLPNERNFSYMWWPEGYTGSLQEVYAATGYYALALNAVTGSISRFGALDTPTRQQAMSLDNSKVKNLPTFSMRYALTYKGTTHKMNYVSPSEENAAIRMLESGTVMQRMDLMYLKANDDPDVYGRAEVCVFPEYFAVNFEVFPDGKRIDNAQVTLTLNINTIYKDVTISSDGKTAILRGANGAGYSVVVPESLDAAIVKNNNDLDITCNVKKISRNTFTGFGIIIIPSKDAKASDAEIFRKRDSLEITATQTSPGNRTQEVTYDATRGMYSIDVNNAFSVDEGKFTDTSIDIYEKVRFTLKNPTDTPVRIPVQFVKDQPLAVTGPSPMLLDATTGEPSGIHIQITRNWHAYDGNTPSNSPRRYWEGKWYHCYTVIEVPANSSVTYDYCVSYARWGGIESVVHSQLCLAGWGGQKIWESCSLGSYGESFCYDVGLGYTWCTMGDICAFGLYSRVDGGKYNWTTNTGGADFIGIHDASNAKLKINNLRIDYRKHGPNLSEVIYTGRVGNKVDFKVTASTPRTNDISMAYQTISYTFLEDTTFNRMWFYQFGADSYNYDYWDRMAVGNNSGVIDFTYNGQSFNGEFAIPAVDSYADYIGHKGCNPIQMPGEGAWFAFLGADAGQSKGNKAISIKEYSATINGKKYTQPSFSIRTTHVQVSATQGWKSAGYELNPPAEAGNVIKAGSTVTFTVHYYNLPAHKSDYYGKGEYLNSLKASKFDTWELAYEYAIRNNISLTAQTGTVERINTPLIRSTGKNDGTIAQFTLTGGIGYVPITISNVQGYSGWRLEQKNGSSWKVLAQGVHGNDYWQAFRCEDGTYELTFNVPASSKRNGTAEFRLVKA